MQFGELPGFRMAGRDPGSQIVLLDPLMAPLQAVLLDQQAISSCRTVPAGGSRGVTRFLSRPFLAGVLGNELTGHAKLAEAGVTINGVVADRYELRADNFNAANSIVEFTSGNVYRAQEGGYLIRLEYTVVVQPQKDLDDN